MTTAIRIKPTTTKTKAKKKVATRTKKAKAKTSKKTKPNPHVITKRSILRALAKEPLRRQAWVEKSELATVGDCPVCAVGAVLQGAKFKNSELKVLASYITVVFEPACTEIFSFPRTGEDAKIRRRDGRIQALEHAREGRYLTALTVLFEGQSFSEKVTSRHREEMIKFVREHFPSSLRIDLKETIDSYRTDHYDSMPWYAERR